jgi:AcrR family transcriptional regulator
MTRPRPDADEPPAPLVWDRPPPARPRAPLSREDVVAAAIPLADAEGLAAVTVRRLAAELDARPMSVYSYARITAKEELFDLMVDQVCAEMLVADPPADWRAALRVIAVRCWEVLLRHPWWVELTGQDVLPGPNGTRHREQVLAAVAGLPLDPATRRALFVAVQAYIVGQAVFALDDGSRPRRSSGEVREAVEQFEAALIGSGEFPNLASTGTGRPASREEFESYFRRGLDWLLHGIAAAVD